MKSLLEQTDELDKLIRQLMKMKSKMWAGQWIDAWRDVNAIIALVEKSRRNLIKDNDSAE